MTSLSESIFLCLLYWYYKCMHGSRLHCALDLCFLMVHELCLCFFRCLTIFSGEICVFHIFARLQVVLSRFSVYIRVPGYSEADVVSSQHLWIAASHREMQMTLPVCGRKSSKLLLLMASSILNFLHLKAGSYYAFLVVDCVGLKVKEICLPLSHDFLN